MIWIAVAVLLAATVLVWALHRRRPSMVRSTEEFRETMRRISPETPSPGVDQDGSAPQGKDNW